MSFYNSWFRLWFGLARSSYKRGFFMDPFEFRELFLGELSRITAEHLRSQSFLESMSRGLSLMTASARLTSWFPFSPRFAGLSALR